MRPAQRRVAHVKRASKGHARARVALPRLLQPLFWDVDPARLQLPRDWPFVARRVLVAGGLREFRWLRKRLGDDRIREAILRSEGRGLSPARIRFYELIFDLPKARADAWVKAARRKS